MKTYSNYQLKNPITCPHGFNVFDPRGCAECQTEAYMDALGERQSIDFMISNLTRNMGKLSGETYRITAQQIEGLKNKRDQLPKKPPGKREDSRF